MGDSCRAGSSLGCQAADQWRNWSGAMYVSHRDNPKQTWGLQAKLTEHRHSCGKRKLRERETVSVSYDTLRCIYIYSIYIPYIPKIPWISSWTPSYPHSIPMKFLHCEENNPVATLSEMMDTGFGRSGRRRCKWETASRCNVEMLICGVLMRFYGDFMDFMGIYEVSVVIQCEFN